MRQPLFLYTTDNCFPCQSLKSLLEKEDVRYIELDVTDSDTEFTKLPQVTFPDGSRMVGFNSKKLRKRLREFDLIQN